MVLGLHNPTIYNPEYTNPNNYITLEVFKAKNNSQLLFGGRTTKFEEKTQPSRIVAGLLHDTYNANSAIEKKLKQKK